MLVLRCAVRIDGYKVDSTGFSLFCIDDRWEVKPRSLGAEILQTCAECRLWTKADDVIWRPWKTQMLRQFFLKKKSKHKLKITPLFPYNQRSAAKMCDFLEKSCLCLMNYCHLSICKQFALNRICILSIPFHPASVHHNWKERHSWQWTSWFPSLYLSFGCEIDVGGPFPAQQESEHQPTSTERGQQEELP